MGNKKEEKEEIKKIIPPEQGDEEDVEEAADAGVLPVRALMKKVFKDETVH